MTNTSHTQTREPGSQPVSEKAARRAVRYQRWVDRTSRTLDVLGVGLPDRLPARPGRAGRADLVAADVDSRSRS